MHIYCLDVLSGALFHYFYYKKELETIYLHKKVW